MDFYKIKVQTVRRNGRQLTEIYPDFVVGRSTDLMVKGKAFYAVWDDAKQLWSTDEYDVQRLVDADMDRFRQAHPQYADRDDVYIRYMSDFSSNSWKNFRSYLANVSDSAKPLDEKITFENTEVKKEDYVSKRVPYPLSPGSILSYDQLMSTIYDPEERRKLEWAIGAIISGDARYIQKFIVLYGAAGAGKSTFLNILQELFKGYYTTFEAKALVGSGNTFATEVFRNNPLVAIQHDGDLSRIEDNTKLNSIVSHEEMQMNEKFKPGYDMRINAFLFMGTNRPVKVTDAKSGIIRRLIDVQPSGRKVPAAKYQILMSQIMFELGAIAYHCLQLYLEMGRNYYANYVPVEMILQTDVFFNFVEFYYDIFRDQPGISLKQAYELYKVYCEESFVEFKLPRHRFREELKNYFNEFHERYSVKGEDVRSYYKGFKTEKFATGEPELGEALPISLDYDESLLDDMLATCPAQYTTRTGAPLKKWKDVDTTLEDIDTHELHFVRVPENHIVIDFDLVDEDGEKSAEENLAAASLWPPTYAEYSKSGKGVHLHYIYEGDPTELAAKYSDGVEIKVYSGNASLRRKLTKCNNIPVSIINSGLPIKEKRVFDKDKIMTERGVRNLIIRNLKKEIHPGTKPSIDFIYKILTDAKESGIEYDLRDMRPDVLAFAVNSTNQASYCVNLVSKMPFYSTESPVDDFVGTIQAEQEEMLDGDKYVNDAELVMFDLEVYPNLFVICWKEHGADKPLHHMINPTPEEVGELMSRKLVGFNNRKYDNHILYAAFMGYSNAALFDLSQRIIDNEDSNAKFAAAYGMSYADVYDFSSKKQSLKLWEIELGLKHMEMDIPWDEPVPEDKIPLVVEYCDNDVLATEAVFDSIQQDLYARQILADLSGLTVNDTTRAHTAKIIFGGTKKPQSQFVYTDLSKMFPGYKYEFGVSTYRDEVVGEGGYVYAEPGMYENVVVLDVESMHPTSIEQLNLFGPFTSTFSELKQARLAIKHKDYDLAKTLLGGALAPYLDDEKNSKDLSDALKIVINSVYGLTKTSYENPFRDIRNKDNIVAKRGALFMIDLKHHVEDMGYNVIHIKTDSIKIENPSAEVIEAIKLFGEQYGYTFDVEAVYSKMCLVNKAVFIARTAPTPEEPEGKWKAVGAQFKHPYVFKTLFTHEPLDFEDLCETKSVQKSVMYLDLNEDLPEGEHLFKFVGRVGRFCPVKPRVGGGILVRTKDDKFYAVSGTTGYRWMESSVVKALGFEDQIDMEYFINLKDEALKTIEKFGSYEWLVSTN